MAALCCSFPILPLLEDLVSTTPHYANSDVPLIVSLQSWGNLITSGEAGSSQDGF
jgi:hypothetical protein